MEYPQGHIDNMKLSKFKRINKNDFASEMADYTEKLSFLINPALESLYELLSNRLTLSDNFDCTIKEFTVTVNSDGKPTSDTGFTIGIKGKYEGLVVLNATCTSEAGTVPDSGIFIATSFDSNKITINYVKGIPANKEFSIKVAVFGQ